MKENIIFDYTKHWCSKGHIFDKRYVRNEKANQLWSDFKRNQKCPYCLNGTKKIFSIFREIEFDENISKSCCGCLNCGWWMSRRVDFQLNGWSHEKREISILREFTVDDLNIPLESLKIELNKRPEIVYGLHHKKFENLVADVLSDFYDVNVQVIGKKDDGGIDQFLCKEKKILQCK